MSISSTAMGAHARRSAHSLTRRTAFTLSAVLVAAFLVVLAAARPASAAGSPCGAAINPIACENSQSSGVTTPDVWDVVGAGDNTIQGFSTDISVNAGSSVGLKIKTTLAYTINVYRLGYYGGAGARLWASNLSHTPRNQPTCLSDPATTLYDCGNWAVSATWNVPATAVSGVYIARLTATNGNASLITFVVRNDSSSADVLYQTSDTTWQAYNRYGDADFYTGSTVDLYDSQSRARKVSYNRPFATRGDNSGRDFLFSNEYPTIRFMEQNGYDMTYISGVDTDRYGATLLKQHKVFLSVGHDEYWSKAQRDNVTSARDAGVSLMFLSGNEMYWHTRYESSIDGSNTSYRTLVCYKTTWDGSNTDPSGENTSTWRDPSFPSTTGPTVPENAISGTMYVSNDSDLAVTVTQAEGKLRLWRNTGLNSMSGGSSALAPHTVGYESDEPADNGFQPAGLVNLSTTAGSVPQYLQDFGAVTSPGSTTHHLTLYKAASGALVFSAGTIQWAWGLDDNHDGTENLSDTRMQQATINMLADMNALPTTLMVGMVAPAPSADTTAPVVTINSPAANANVANGASVTVSGTASDTGGVVAGVEVSLDGGTSWHPATGTASWSYGGVVRGNGAISLKVRATDDSANTSSPVTRTVNTACPCTIAGNVVPKTPAADDSGSYQLGVRFTADSDGFVNGVRFYKGTGNTGTHTATLWSTDGTALATGTFTGETASGWQTMNFTNPVPTTRNTTYVVSYFTPNGHYAADAYAFSYRGIDAGGLHILGGPSQSNGIYGVGNTFPTQTYHQTNYYVDPIFSPTATQRPTVSAVSPSNGATASALTSNPSATFTAAMDPATITFSLKTSAQVAVPGTSAYNASTKTVTFSPNAVLDPSTPYTASVNGTDTSGTAMTQPYSWTFTTAASTNCPCMIFPNSAVPAVPSADDGQSVNLGVKFSADTDGAVSAIRFYKGAANTGTHVGYLWTADGTQLASVTFSNETASGWQVATLSQPVLITANTTYIVSYVAPSGGYSVGANGVATGVDSGLLHIPAGGSLYLYGAAGLPTAASNTNYYVDVVFNSLSQVAPTVTSTTPANGDTGIATATGISATMSLPIDPATATFTVTGPSGSVAGTKSYNAATKTVTFQPSANLANSVTYTASVSGAVSTYGATQGSAYTWTFTTVAAYTCPCSLFAADASPAVPSANDTQAVTLGVKFSASVAGSVTGLRFYKGSLNTGTHTGSLWTAGGARLATVTFTNETAAGWQSATFADPVPVTAGTSYVLSYFAPNGGYSYDSGFFTSAYVKTPLTVPGGANGLYSYDGDVLPVNSYNSANYWVDPIFDSAIAADRIPPAVESASPLAKASSVNPSTAVVATFSEDVNSSTIVVSVMDPANNPAAGTTSYNAATKTATFTPTSPLARGVAYTASVTASDLAGNAMPAPYSWSFTTMQPDPVAGVCPCSVWTDATVPTTVAVAEARAVDLGVKFTSDWAGPLTGVRFYKSAQNTGVHSVSLWSTTGTLLATANATNEVASGWQTVLFATPPALTIGTTYIVSYHTDSGHFSMTGAAFTSAGVDKGPLHIPAHAGVYLYGSTSSFPSTTSDSNYFIDPVFGDATSGPPADTTPPVITAINASVSGSTGTVTWTTDEASTSSVSYGTSSAALTSSASTAGLTGSHSVALTGLAPNTRYYYRVTSADAANNSATAPATANSVAPSTTPFTDATLADFALGTVASSYVAGNADGEVTLAPAAAVEFGGTALPSGTTSSNVVAGGSTTVANGVATVKAANLTTTATYSNGRALETLATLNRNQSIGWVTSSNATVRMSFTVNASNQLIATVNDGFFNNATGVAATGWTVAPHTFRVEWTSSAATFYLDGVQKYTHAFTSAYSNLRPQFTDSAVAAPDLVVDWYRIAPYAASGTFTSRIFDAQATVIWDALTLDATIPTGTTLTLRVRTGDTSTPDGSWSAYATIASGTSVNKTARYLQYQVTFTSAGSRFTTPSLRSTTMAFHV